MKRKAFDPPPSTARPGFTLVELLVVIGIISILVSLLIPAVSMVRKQVLSTKCLSNLRQIGIAISSYANDHNYCLVPGDYLWANGKPTSTGGGSWADTLADQSYLNVPIGHIRFPMDNPAYFDLLYDRENVLVCPSGQDEDVAGYGLPTSQTDPRGTMFGSRSSDVTLEAVRTWYAVNGGVNPDPKHLGQLPFNILPDFSSGGADWRVNRVTQFNGDSQLPLVFDGVWMFNYDPNMINARHGDKTQTNILFADWHCETQTTSSLPNDNWYLK